jgi:hypothetical protein
MAEDGNRAKTLTKPNKSAENTAERENGSACAELVRAAAAIDPLGVMPDVGHLMPQGGATGAALDLTGEARKGEAGAAPLANKRREKFCQVLTGWGGDGLRKRNCEAYEIVYGKGGATARTQSSWLLAIPEVKERVEWLERKVEEAKRHDWRAAQQEIDELRLGLVEKAKNNSKLAALALAAARDFEAAHGLKKEGAPASAAMEIQAVEGDGLGGVRAILAKVIKSG